MSAFDGVRCRPVCLNECDEDDDGDNDRQHHEPGVEDWTRNQWVVPWPATSVLHASEATIRTFPVIDDLASS